MRRQRDRRDGQALVEFAVIAFVLYLFLAATLELGRATFGVQTIQAAADLAAREISRTPLAPDFTLTDALNSEAVCKNIFDERLLVLNLDDYRDRPEDTDDSRLNKLFRRFPVVNQQLRSVMIVDQSVDQSISKLGLLRYPGALVTPSPAEPDHPLPDDFTPTPYRVVIPQVKAAADGMETIVWRPVVEEIDPGAFSIVPRPEVDPRRQGFVGIRINYPFQAASLVAYRPSPEGPFEPNGANAVLANDAGVTQENDIPGGRALADLTPENRPNRLLQPHGGRFGLGSLQAGVARDNLGGQSVRPFRRLLMGQAIYRREVFGPPEP